MAGRAAVAQEPSEASAPAFARRLGVWDATLIVMGGIVGSGIFANPHEVAKELPSGRWILAAWAAGGGLALLGAFVYAELAARRPEVGGQYAYLRDAWHPLVAFLYGWVLLLVIQSGGMAAVALVFGRFARELLGGGPPESVLALLALATLTAANALGVGIGTGVQNLLMVLKAAAIAALVVCGLVVAAPSLPSAAAGAGGVSASAFGAALAPVLFAYGGWQTASFVSGEMRDPQRDLPRGLLLGVLGVIALYIGVNTACLRVLGGDGLAATPAPASAVMEEALGPVGARFIAAGIAISTLGLLSQGMLTAPRVYYAMAKDGVFFARVGELHPTTRVPVVAIVLQGGAAMALTLWGAYRQILDYVVSVDFLAFGLTAASLFVFRRRDAAHRGFRTPGHPWTTALFVGGSWLFVANLVAERPRETLLGFAVLATGVPAYLLWRRAGPGPVVVLLGVLAAGGCGRPDAAVPSPRTAGGPLRVGLAAPPGSLDPHHLNEFATFEVLSNVYDTLVGFDASQRVEPALATSWSSRDDHHWTFELRRGVTFHDGRPLMARDVVASLRRAREHPKSQFASYLVDVTEVRARGDHAVEILTGRPSPVLLNKLAFVFIAPADAPAEVRSPLGSGPYRLATRDGGRVVALRGFAGHWRGAPEIAEVDYVSVPAPGRSRALLAREVDLVLDLAPAEAPVVAAQPGFVVRRAPGPSVDVLLLRTDTPPFHDVRVRRALSLALDREALVDSLLQGFGKPAGQVVTRHVFGFDPDLPPPKRDLPAARKLLAEAGHREGLEFELEHRAGLSLEPVAAQLAEVGVRVRLVARHWNQLIDRIVKGEVRAAYLGLASDSGEAGDLLASTFHTPDRARGFGDANREGYSNPALDQLIETAAATPRPGDRLALLQQGLRLLAADLPRIPVVEREHLVGARRGITWEDRADGRLSARSLRLETR